MIALEHAKKAIKIADHMLTITHNVVNDPKLLLIVTEKLALSQQHGIKAVLHYELYHKRIPVFKDNFGEMFALFKVRCTRRLNLDLQYVDIIHSVQELLEHHRKSPVEFARKDNYVICSNEYKTDVISKDLLKKYVEKTKTFIEEIEKMLIR